MKIALIWIVYSLCIFAFIIPSSVLAASPGHLACGVDIPSESEPETESEESVPEESTPDKSCAEGLTFIGCCDRCEPSDLRRTPRSIGLLRARISEPSPSRSRALTPFGISSRRSPVRA